MSVELGERNSRGVSHERNVMFVCNLSQRREVSHLKLRIGDYFEEDAAGVGINGAAHLVEIRQVAQMRCHAESRQRLRQQRVGVAEHVS